ncbi:hypothetical protein [Methanobrevibacter olleyae]|uniref:TPR repeat-containing protein n=1 Tax=Methanobrevibacter olleyae TaxID=294671 RepID=A0A126QYP3_METOL|nr:hypothetical protein [Methanobrevibacter olleyae]AMK15283.1 TPR repeat-containing protein [Methanobrevibacter olleyae]SFL29339.1 hypothetical protein SAMN02910297_00476 [Methanobrevibacter olleyae]
MTSTEINLEKARNYNKVKKYDKSLEIYESLLESGEKLSKNDIDRYGWNLYFAKIKETSMINELEESAKKLIGIVKQKDSSKVNKPCPYTLSVIKLMKIYSENEEYLDVLRWASKLKAELLSNHQFKPNEDITLNSIKENYYLQTTKALLSIYKYGQTIRYCQEALDNIPNFNNNNDTWFKLRMAKSYKELGEYDKSIELLDDILKYKKDWYLSRDMAENYFFKEEYDDSLKWAAKATLSHDGEIENKINLFSLIADILEIKGFEDEAIMNRYMYYVIRNAKEWSVDEELLSLLDSYGLDLDNKDFKSLFKEYKNMWISLKYFGQERQYGLISKVFEHGKAGFIDSNGKSYYFNTFEFMDDKDYIYEGTEVSFYLEDAYNKKKDEMVKNAVNIYCEVI